MVRIKKFLILDACRVDVMSEVADEYSFLNQPDEITSVGSSSIEWIENTFTDEYKEEMRNTAYVTGESVQPSYPG